METFSGFPAMQGELYHPTLGQVKYSIQEVSDDPDEQVEATIALMRDYAKSDANAQLLQQDVGQAWGSDDAVGDTFRYLCRNGTRGMQFVRDEVTGQPVESLQSRSPYAWRPVIEALIRPVDQAILPNPQGDCDDFAMYGAAHLIARGIPDVRYATAAADGAYPDVYSHVYLVAYPKDGPYAGQRVPIDLSHGAYPGWEVPNLGKFREWNINAGFGLLGLGLLSAGAYLLYKGYRSRRN